ncbi:hypothetical protein FQA39_LY07616 [Lamprigera yunnana]|nr:hypothetical protein FQA39_LY07616 [Lamprigera yunnana]
MQKPIVTIKDGILQGKIETDCNGNKYYSFQGIPYGKPPIGELRFKAPLPAESWKGIRDSTANGNDCLINNRDPIFQRVAESEDCLYLNLPSKSEQLQPVMFWIHGGCFVTGSGSSLVYEPNFLIPNEVVIVTINYRFGLLGFLNFEDASLDIPGNAGLKDQVLALRWVQDNIAEFCGDSRNVTVFGVSAGAASAHYLMLSPSSREAANEEEIFHIISNMSGKEVLKLQEKIPDKLEASFKRCIGPIVESELSKTPLITQEPEDLILSGNYNEIPMIIGFNSREGLISDIQNNDVRIYGHVVKDFEKAIPHNMNIFPETGLSKKIAKKIHKFYYGHQQSSEENKNQYYFLQGDNLFLWPIYSTISYHAITSKKRIFLYRLSIESTLNLCKNNNKINNPGACHGDDVTYLFKGVFTPFIIPNSIEDITVKRLTTLWTNFAKYGDPNPTVMDKLVNVNWQPIEGHKLNYLEIGEKLTVGINPDQNRMDLWKKIALISTNKL